MLSAKRIFNAKEKYMKMLTSVSAKKRLQYLNLSGSEKDLESYFGILSVCLAKSGYNDEELVGIVQEIMTMKELSTLIDSKVQEILKNSRVMLDNENIKTYINKYINPYYKCEFRINRSREISFLPLDLRLFIYNYLFQIEKDSCTRLHYLDRIDTTLSKLGEKDLASIIVSFKWLLNWGMIIGHDLDTVFKEEIKFINNAETVRITMLKTDGIDAGKYYEEILYSMLGFAYLENIHDRKMAIMLIQLLGVYYKDLNEIEDHIKKLEMYLKTSNSDEVQSIRKVIDKRRNN